MDLCKSHLVFHSSTFKLHWCKIKCWGLYLAISCLQLSGAILIKNNWLKCSWIVIVNQHGYPSILKRHSLWAIRVWGQLYFAASKHSPQLCRNYLEKKVTAEILFVMAWSAQSPDLNPIELEWEKLDPKLATLHQPAPADFWEVLQKVWRKLRLTCRFDLIIILCSDKWSINNHSIELNQQKIIKIHTTWDIASLV